MPHAYICATTFHERSLIGGGGGTVSAVAVIEPPVEALFCSGSIGRSLLAAAAAPRLQNRDTGLRASYRFLPG